MFVHPVQIAEIMRRHKSIIRARLVVERPQSADEMTLLVEIGEPAEPEAAIAATVAGCYKAARRGQAGTRRKPAE